MKLLSLSCLVVMVVVVVQVLLEPAALAACGDPGYPDDCGADTCLYQPDCTCCDVDDLVPDPDDCQLFYVCTGNGTNDHTTLPASCSGDEVFDPESQECVSPGSYECPICNLDPICVYDCDTTPNRLFSSHDDCNEYYTCFGDDILGPLRCDATTPFFDGRGCQTEETRCCRCWPSCAAGQDAIIDPLDCRKYYLCSSTTLYPGECPEGEFFDAALQDCSPTTTCITTCTNVVNTDGCIDPFMCLETGFFAMCPKRCVNEYFHCESVSEVYQEPNNCVSGTVFHPDDHTCVSPSDCPYPAF